MNRDLDEIEMELGKESMKYRCEFWEFCPSLHCSASREHTKVSTCETGEECGYAHGRARCIPVEPERVKSCWHPVGPCEHPPGECLKCDYWRHAPSPGLLQRMGMCTWPEDEKDWIIIADVHVHFTEQEALDRVRDQTRWPGYRAFRWQDGVQG